MAVDERDLTRGLDALEVPLPPKVSRGRKIWRSAWPKLLAVAIFFGIWQFLYWIEWKPHYLLPSPVDTFRGTLRQLGRAVPRGAPDARARSPWLCDRARDRQCHRRFRRTDPGAARRGRDP